LQDIPTSLRLMVRLDARAQTSVKELMPLLSKYFDTTKLASSGLEVLQFQDSEVFKQVKKLLQDRYAGAPHRAREPCFVPIWMKE
jgi:hypothetical protein